MISAPCPQPQSAVQSPPNSTQQSALQANESTAASTSVSVSPNYEPRPPEESPEEQSDLLKCEPRQLPGRSEVPVEVPIRKRVEPSGHSPALGVSSAQQSPRWQHRSRLLRFGVPVIFLLLVVVVAFGVKTFLEMDVNAEGASPGSVSKEENGILDEGEVDTFDELIGQQGKPETLGKDESEMVAIGEGEITPIVLMPVDDGIAALKLLERFLEMETLDEREPYMETQHDKAELTGSVLDGKLPDALKITVDVRETNSIERVIDFFYHVNFEGEDGEISPQTMLVRKRGEQPPMVVVDPFLDLFGGRLEKFASEPSNEAGTFQVIVSAGAFCYDDVPGAEEKYTLKILSRENAREIAKAYFGKQSKIGRMLEDETSGFAYGQAKPCTIFMRWNNDEDQLKPFLEALDIKALNWNP